MIPLLKPYSCGSVSHALLTLQDQVCGMSTVTETNGDVETLSTGLDDVRLDDLEVVDDNELAMQGIVLLMNNKWDESLALFEKYKSQSVIMSFGGAFVTYMQGEI